MPESSTRRPTLRAVCDAGPVIHLEEIGCREVWGLFQEVILPMEVDDEVHRRPELPGPAATKLEPMRILALDAGGKRTAERLAAKHELSTTDAAVLAMSRREGPGLILTDDLDLRDAAKVEGLRPAGSVGLLLRAASRGLLSPKEADHLLVDLFETSSLFITERLVERARTALASELG